MAAQDRLAAVQNHLQMASNDNAEELVLHHLDNSRSQRILWLLEELGVPYTIKLYKRQSTQLAPPELAAIHPLGKAPVVTDHGAVIAESGAIIEYLLTKYDSEGKFKPAPENALTNTYYTHLPEGSLMGPTVFKYIMLLAPDQAPWIVRPLVRIVGREIAAKAADPNIKGAIKMVGEHLSSLPAGYFVAGGPNPTSADFMLIFALESILQLVPDWCATQKSIRAYVDMIHKRPAYQRGLEKGGKYDYA